MTADDWHKLADERSTEIVRLTGEKDLLAAAHEGLVAANCRLAAKDAQWQLTVKSLTEDLERERARHDERVVEGVQRLKHIRALQEQNLALQKRLEVVDDALNEADTEDAPAAVNEFAAKLSEALQKLPGTLPLPFPEAVLLAFHWRDPKRADGLYDALPGDGYGFLGATTSKLTLTFDCAGVMAEADIPYEQLQPVLASGGLFIGKASDWNPLGSLMHAEAKDLADKLCVSRNEADALRADVLSKHNAMKMLIGQKEGLISQLAEHEQVEQGIRNYVEWAVDQIKVGVTNEPLDRLMRALTGLLERKQGRVKPDDDMQVRAVQGDGASEFEPD